MEDSEFITFLDEGEPNVNLYGGKGSHLIKLKKMGVKVPNGFIINTTTFEKFIQNVENSHKIKKFLNQKLLATDIINYSKEIQSLILESSFPTLFLKELREAFNMLEKTDDAKVLIAVRSSANIEDIQNYSFAGQAESYLCLETFEELIENIKKCWISLYAPGALLYFLRIINEGHNIALKDVKMAVIVQKMIESNVSGVLFTTNILNNNPNQILINSTWGLGEAIANNLTIPDTIIVDKNDLTIVNKIIGDKEKQVINHPSESCTIVKEVEKNRRKLLSLTHSQIKTLCRISVEIEKKLEYPQDIEWAFKNGNLYILQSRPITTLK
jgi:pyruvate,water dikinase